MSHLTPSVKVLGRIISSMVRTINIPVTSDTVKVWCVGNEFHGVPGELGKEERQYLDKVCKNFKDGKALYFLEYVHKNQWNYFIKQTKGIAGDVTIWGHLPDDWSVDGKKRIKVMNELVYNTVEWTLDRQGQYPFLGYKRDVKSLDQHFLLTYGSMPEVERENVVQVLERLKVLDNSIYSRPNISENFQKCVSSDYIFTIDNKSPKYRSIEGTDEVLDKAEYLYHHSKAFPALYQAAQRVHCHAVLDCFPFNNQMLPIPSEKWVWPVFMGIPWIYIGSEGQMQTLRSWGFEPNETFRSDVRGVAEQMMWLKSIFDDPDLAQKWQEKQGELIIKNREALDRVLEIISSNKDI